MTGLIDYITGSNRVDILVMWCILANDAFRHLVTCLGRPLHQSVPEPSYTDSEVITVALIIETFFAGHEDLGIAFVKQYLLDLFPKLLDKSHFKRRRWWLTNIIDMIRRFHAQAVLDPDDRVRSPSKRMLSKRSQLGFNVPCGSFVSGLGRPLV